MPTLTWYVWILAEVDMRGSFGTRLLLHSQRNKASAVARLRDPTTQP